MKKLNGICNALKNGYSLGCWASGGRVAIVSILADDKTTVASGEGGRISESFINANSDWYKYQKNKVPYEKRTENKESLMTGARSDQSDDSIFGWLDHWVKSGGGYLQVYFNSYSDIYIAMLDGYDENINRVIQLGFNKDLFKAIESASNSPKVIKEK